MRTSDHLTPLRLVQCHWAAVMLAAVAACLWAAPASAADYTVTSASGDYLDLANVGLQAGDTVWLDGHTRTKLILKNITAGTAQNPITVTNTDGQFVINNTVDDKGLQFWNCQNIIVKGTYVGENYGIKINQVSGHGMAFINGSTDFELCDVEITGCGIGVSAKSDGLQRPTWAMENVKIHDCYIHDVGGEGLYIGSSFWTDTEKMPHEVHNAEIYDNYIEDAGWDGIQLGCATEGSSIHDNVIIGFGLTGNGSQNEGIRANPGTAGHIYNNWVEDGAGSGIFPNPYTDTWIYNNVLVDCDEHGIYIGDDADTQSGTQVYLFNNTIVSPGQYGLKFATKVSLGTSGSLFYNNIVADPGTGNIWRVYGTQEADLTDNYNLMVATIAAAGFEDADNGDYSLDEDSDAVDAGTNVSGYGVSDDIEGTSRPQGDYYDIGAYELVSEGGGEDDIITPIGWGQASGSSYCPATYAFDSQPTWDSNGDCPTGGDTSPYQRTLTGYAERYFYIDFGADYADLRITQTWTRYMPSSTGSYSGFGGMWWDDDIDCSNDGTTENTLDFECGTVSTGSEVWVQDVDTSGSPITPAGRYLLVYTGSSPSMRPNEFCFVGYDTAGGPSNSAPIVDAGSDDLVLLSDGASLDGTVSDDGNPDPPGSVTITWTKQSGPGSVTFGNANAVDTTAGFAASGTYVLRLTADDSDLEAYDEVTITVNDDVTIITPTDWGQAGGAYCPAQGAFDDQPTWDDESECPVGDDAVPHEDTDTNYANRHFYIDFGANYANVRILETWTRYRPYSGGDYSGFGAMWWDDDTDTTNDGTSENTLDWQIATGVSNISSQQWVQDVDCSGSPITPAARYLIVNTGASPSARPNEFCIVGYTDN